MRILCLGSVNCWLITSSDTGHNQSLVPNINTAHFSWQRLNWSDAATTLLNSITSYTEVRELFFVVSEKMLFTLSKISSSVSSDCAAATEYEKNPLSFHSYTNLHLCGFLSVCCAKLLLHWSSAYWTDRKCWTPHLRNIYIWMFSFSDKVRHRWRAAFGSKSFPLASLLLLLKKLSICHIQASPAPLPEFQLGGQKCPPVFCIRAHVRDQWQCCIWERSRYFPLCWDGLCPFRKKNTFYLKQTCKNMINIVLIRNKFRN